jgi:hypothetical protein
MTIKLIVAVLLPFASMSSFAQSRGVKRPATADMLLGQWQSTEDQRSFLLFEKGVRKSR